MRKMSNVNSTGTRSPGARASPDGIDAKCQTARSFDSGCPLMYLR
jgi:hypothetical protein